MTEIEIKLDRLQKMAESETDQDRKAALRWAIFQIEQKKDDPAGDMDEMKQTIQETIAGAVIATMHNLGTFTNVDRDDLMNTLMYDTLQTYDPETLRSIFNEWRERYII